MSTGRHILLKMLEKTISTLVRSL
ncbi:unnamed protein product, partial [Adineta steineri]